MTHGRWFSVLWLAGAVLVATGSAGADFSPWSPLVVEADPDHAETWIHYRADDANAVIHTVNAGDYDVGFDQAKSNDSARGLNSLTFTYGGQSTGHLITDSQAGSFAVNNGGSRTYSDLLVLVSIDAASLPMDFALTLAPAGQQVQLGPDDFGYYDPSALGYATGRPSGFYPSVTDPPNEALTYDFDRGMVTIVAATGLSMGGTAPSVAVDYDFDNLPGTAIFSVYVLVDGSGWIHHTNRAVKDENDLSAGLSTFAVVPEPGSLAVLALASAVGLCRRRPWRRGRRKTDALGRSERVSR